MLNTYVSHNKKKSKNQKEVPLYESNTDIVDNKHKTHKNIRRTNSIKKQKENKFSIFLDFKKENDDKKEEKKEEENDKKKFKDFSILGN